MRILKTLLAFGLVAVFFVGCSKNADNTNTMTTTSNTTTTSNANSKVSNSSSMPNMPTMPANTSTSSTSNNNSTAPTSSGEGETFTNQAAGVRFTLPSGWTSKNQDESIIATSPHDAVSVVFQVPKDDFNKAVNDLSERLDSIIKNGKVTSPGTEGTHNGMRAYTAGGTGVVNGQEILWEVDILQAKKPFFVLTFAAPEMFQMHKSEYQQLLNSIQRTE